MSHCSPIRSAPFPIFNTIGEEEALAVASVLRSGKLSGFLGTWSDEFSGGPEVKALESEWADFFKIRHAISVNSATSGLYAAMGALELKSEDEVIVTPTSMSASAVAPLVYHAKPVFADILNSTCTLDPDDVLKKITPKTRAIIVVNLFGHPAHLDEIMDIAKKHRIVVIEDNAQAPYAQYKGQFTGTIADMGVFSLNRHKHIQTGEGGMVVTNNDDLANRLRLIRNHAESVVEAKGDKHLGKIVGFNYRMTEIEAAIARTQLKKLPRIAEKKSSTGNKLAEMIRDIPGVYGPTLFEGSRHVYYLFPLRIDEAALNMRRDDFVDILSAEGMPIRKGYVKPLHLLPVMGGEVNRGRCPVAERMYEKELAVIPWCAYDFDTDCVDEISRAIHKIVD